MGFTAEAHYLVFDRLAVRREDGSVVGGLLEKWQSSDQGVRFTLTLRPGIRFHDGVTMSSDDLLFTFESIRDPQNQSPYAEVLNFIERVERIDDRSVSVTLRHPYWHFIDLLDVGVLPAHLLRGRKLDDPSFNQNPIGAGPFRVTKIEDGVVELERFAGYYGEKAGLEQLTVVQYDSEALWRRLLAHHIDAALYVPWSKYRFLDHLGTIKTDKSARFYGIGLCFNIKRKPFDSARARRAFATAIDRKRIVENTEFGFGIPTERLAPDSSAVTRLDIEPARREIGGRTVHLAVTASDSTQIDVAMELQRQLSAADVTVQIDPGRRIDEADVFICGNEAPTPLESGAYKYGSALDPDLEDVDAIFERIAETRDETVRGALFRQVEDRFLEEAPKTMLFWQPFLSAYRAEYCGYHMVNLFDGLEKMRPCQ
jgi:ABC-type transport system substrate-binding protein